jgi:hypothetical protein
MSQIKQKQKNDLLSTLIDKIKLDFINNLQALTDERDEKIKQVLTNQDRTAIARITKTINK